jgi:hypothetical protein
MEYRQCCYTLIKLRARDIQQTRRDAEKLQAVSGGDERGFQDQTKHLGERHEGLKRTLHPEFKRPSKIVLTEREL